MKEITRKNYIRNREEFILNKCREKRVLHLGCCDSPSTEFKFNKNIALFQLIENECSDQLGLDYEKEALNHLHSIGHKNVSFFDLNQPGEINFHPEIIVFADTLEHLTNLENAINILKRSMNEKTELIITVPNATMFERIIGNFRGYIHEHGDHKVSFTYTALKQLVLFNNLDISNILFSDQLNLHKDNSERVKESILKTTVKLPLRVLKLLIRKSLVFFFPLFSECLVIVCKLKK